MDLGLGLVLRVDLLAEPLQVGLQVAELAQEGGTVTGLGIGQPPSVVKLRTHVAGERKEEEENGR